MRAIHKLKSSLLLAAFCLMSSSAMLIAGDGPNQRPSGKDRANPTVADSGPVTREGPNQRLPDSQPLSCEHLGQDPNGNDLISFDGEVFVIPD